jgi:CubicO group peptidase (beta-lactamase class C family)
MSPDGRDRLPAGALAEVSRIADEFDASGRAPGLAYGVLRDGALVAVGGRGQAVLGGAAPTSSSVFRIASMTKSFVAAAVLALRDEGRVLLDAAVSSYVPELVGLALPTRDSRPPTVRDLLTMTAGWPTDDPWADREESMSPAGLSSLLAAGVTFDEAPGIAYDYSNLSYVVLGRVITEVSGMPFQDAVTARVLAPLGMRSTAFRALDVPDGLLVDGHYRRDEAWHVEPTSETGEFAALGGLFSSVEDLSRWVATLCGAFPPRDEDDPAVPAVRATLREMQQGQRFVRALRGVPGDDPAHGEVTMYGFGLVVHVHPRFGQVVSHAGGYPGFGSRMTWHPETGVGVIGLANARYAGPYRDTGRMLVALLEGLDAPARVVRASSRARERFDDVDALVDSWDDARADAVFSANVDQDLPRDRRRSDVAAAVASIGGLDPGRLEESAYTPSHRVWWRRGPRGRLRVEVLLTPQAAQRVQTLDVRAVLDPDASVRRAADELVRSLWAGSGWPTSLARSADVDVDSLEHDVARARAAGVPAALPALPSTAPTAHDATFELRGPDMRAALRVALDHISTVSACTLTIVADDWPTSVRVEDSPG